MQFYESHIYIYGNTQTIVVDICIRGEGVEPLSVTADDKVFFLHPLHSQKSELFVKLMYLILAADSF